MPRHPHLPPSCPGHDTSRGKATAPPSPRDTLAGPPTNPSPFSPPTATRIEVTRHRCGPTGPRPVSRLCPPNMLYCVPARRSESGAASVQCPPAPAVHGPHSRAARPCDLSPLSSLQTGSAKLPLPGDAVVASTVAAAGPCGARCSNEGSQRRPRLGVRAAPTSRAGRIASPPRRAVVGTCESDVAVCLPDDVAGHLRAVLITDQGGRRRPPRSGSDRVIRVGSAAVGAGRYGAVIGDKAARRARFAVGAGALRGRGTA